MKSLHLHALRFKLIALSVVAERERYAAGTKVGGKNVGGQWKPKSGSSGGGTGGDGAVAQVSKLAKMLIKRNEKAFDSLSATETLAFQGTLGGIEQPVAEMKARLYEASSKKGESEGDIFSKAIDMVDKAFNGLTEMAGKVSTALSDMFDRIEKRFPSVAGALAGAVGAVTSLSVIGKKLNFSAFTDLFKGDSTLEKLAENTQAEIEKSAEYQAKLQKRLAALDSRKDKSSEEAIEAAKGFSALYKKLQSPGFSTDEDVDAILSEMLKKSEDVKNLLSDVQGVEEKGFIQRRLDELKSGSLTESGRKWRQGVIDAEVEYGDELDAFLDSDGSEESYKKLIDKVRKRDPKTEKIEEVSEKTHEEMAKLFGDKPEEYQPEEYLKNRERYAQEALSLAECDPKIKVYWDGNSAMTANHAEVDIDLYKETGYPPVDKKLKGFLRSQRYRVRREKVDGIVVYDPELTDIFYLLNNEQADMRTETEKALIAHEIGHVVEVASDSADESVSFVLAKDLSNFQRQLQENQVVTEVLDILKDMGIPRLDVNTFNRDFATEYTKTVYPNGQATEVVSTGVEALSDPKLLRSAVARDREHILYTLYVLQKEHA